MPETRRFKLTIEYDGGRFVGWQRQTNGRSVQGDLEAAAAALFGVETPVTGAGRTDAGVHARGQVAHFDAATALEPAIILRALNAALTEDVTVRSVEVAAPDFHARFSAASRAYEYTIRHGRVSIHRGTAWILYPRVERTAMEAAAAVLPGTHDFTTFSKARPDNEHGYCHVFEASWTGDEEESRFTIRANRFLHGMVRALVGGMVEVGRGKLAPEAFAALLELRQQSLCPMLAPPHGLVLAKVSYDPDEYAFVRNIMERLRSE